jgi:hypothetical protein
MNPTSALSSLQNFNPLLAILWAGFTCGTLDISAALVVYRYFGRPPMRLLQGIAAGEAEKHLLTSVKTIWRSYEASVRYSIIYAVLGRAERSKVGLELLRTIVDAENDDDDFGVPCQILRVSCAVYFSSAKQAVHGVTPLRCFELRRPVRASAKSSKHGTE